MIRSMTGFGAAEMTTEERRISIEMRAVNNRYLDFNIRMPKRYIPLEGNIRELLKKTIHRGKVDVYISEERCGAGKGALMLDRELAAQYIEKIGELSRLVREAYPYAEELQNPAVTRLSGLDIARFPEVLTLVEGETNEDELWDSLSACLSEAVKKFDESRLAEGDRLARWGVRSVLPGFDDPGTGPAGNFGRTIRAVISDDIKIIELAGIIHGFQILDDIPDHPFLVMRRNQHQETGRRIVVRVILCGFFETEKADDNLIEH